MVTFLTENKRAEFVGPIRLLEPPSCTFDLGISLDQLYKVIDSDSHSYFSCLSFCSRIHKGFGRYSLSNDPLERRGMSLKNEQTHHNKTTVEEGLILSNIFSTYHVPRWGGCNCNDRYVLCRRRLVCFVIKLRNVPCPRTRRPSLPFYDHWARNFDWWRMSRSCAIVVS